MEDIFYPQQSPWVHHAVRAMHIVMRPPGNECPRYGRKRPVSMGGKFHWSVSQEPPAKNNKRNTQAKRDRLEHGNDNKEGDLKTAGILCSGDCALVPGWNAGTEKAQIYFSLPLLRLRGDQRGVVILCS